MPAFFCIALTTAAVKSLFTNFRDDPLDIHEENFLRMRRRRKQKNLIRQMYFFTKPENYSSASSKDRAKN